MKLYAVWARTRPWVFGVAAASPLVAIGLSIFGQPAVPLVETLLALVLVHTGLLLELGYVNNKALNTLPNAVGRKVKSISQNPLWASLEGKQLDSFDIVALNGGKVAKCLRNRNVRVERLRIVVPSEKALTLFFSDLSEVSLDERMKKLSIGQEEFSRITKLLLRDEKIGSVEIRSLPFFPGRIGLLPSSDSIAVGRYLRDEEHEPVTGLQVTTFMENRADIVNRERESFQALWDSLGGGNR